jgi:general secretion pathway protein H
MKRRVDQRSGQRGFTLVEILVVVLIIGLGIGIVTFTVGGNQPLALRNDAQQFAAQVELVAAEAALGGEVWGLQFYRETERDAGDERIAWRWLHFREPDSADSVGEGKPGKEKEKKVEQKLGWQPEPPRGMDAGGAFATNVEAVLEIEGSEVPIEALDQRGKRGRQERDDAKEVQPDVWFAPGGEMTPFALHLRFVGDSDGPVVRGDAIGRLELDAPDAAR